MTPRNQQRTLLFNLSLRSSCMYRVFALPETINLLSWV
jgi:hypothetical protein